MGLFILLRLLFFLYHAGQAANESFLNVIGCWIQGLKHDLSLTCYFLFLPWLLFSILQFRDLKILKKILQYYSLALLMLVTVLSVADLEIYREWGVKVNVRALQFLEHPLEALETVRTGFLAGGILAITFLVWIFFFLFRKLPLPRNEPSPLFMKFIFIVSLPVLLVIGLRGGTGPIPLQVSDVYFSTNNFLNLTATNTTWQLFSGINENRKVLKGNPFVFFQADEATKIVSELHHAPKDTSIRILETNRPNIFLVIMEGVSAEAISGMGGFAGNSPNFDQLINEGLLFDSAYASGNLSDQGMSAIFSGFPAQPHVSITMQPEKFAKLPSLTRSMKSMGYNTFFIFGGELTYGNMRAYMLWNGFDKILEQRDLDEYPAGKLGIHDEYIFDKAVKEVRSLKQPFFSSVFTSSTHSPYDHPETEQKHKSEHPESSYVNSVHYFDRCLGAFIEKVKAEPWFSNTIFIFISDHSHRTPKGTERYMAEYRRIPFLLWGPVLQDSLKGTRVKKIVSQVDLAATLLKQLGGSAQQFEWSKDLFNPFSASFAYFENTDGFGWVRPGAYITWSPAMKELWVNKTANRNTRLEMEREGKAYLQVLFGKYLEE